MRNDSLNILRDLVVVVHPLTVEKPLYEMMLSCACLVLLLSIHDTHRSVSCAQTAYAIYAAAHATVYVSFFHSITLHVLNSTSIFFCFLSVQIWWCNMATVWQRQTFRFFEISPTVRFETNRWRYRLDMFYDVLYFVFILFIIFSFRWLRFWDFHSSFFDKSNKIKRQCVSYLLLSPFY